MVLGHIRMKEYVMPINQLFIGMNIFLLFILTKVFQTQLIPVRVISLILKMCFAFTEVWVLLLKEKCLMLYYWSLLLLQNSKRKIQRMVIRKATFFGYYA